MRGESIKDELRRVFKVDEREKQNDEARRVFNQLNMAKFPCQHCHEKGRVLDVQDGGDVYKVQCGKCNGENIISKKDLVGLGAKLKKDAERKTMYDEFAAIKSGKGLQQELEKVSISDYCCLTPEERAKIEYRQIAGVPKAEPPGKPPTLREVSDNFVDAVNKRNARRPGFRRAPLDADKAKE